MPRPPEVTQEDTDRWEANRLSHEKSEPTPDTTLLERLTGFRPPNPAEVWHSGCWLGEKLKEVGASEQEIKELCTTQGQKSLFSKDVWQTAQENLDDFNRGEWDKPGRELADRLNEEFMPAIIAGMKNK